MVVQILVTSGPAVTRWLQTICFINFLMLAMLVTLSNSTARQVAQTARDQCTFVSDWSLSRHLLGTQENGSNFILSSLCSGPCNRRCVSLLFWRLEKNLVIIRPSERNLHLPRVMSSHMVPHYLDWSCQKL